MSRSESFLESLKHLVDYTNTCLRSWNRRVVLAPDIFESTFHLLQAISVILSSCSIETLGHKTLLKLRLAGLGLEL